MSLYWLRDEESTNSRKTKSGRGDWSLDSVLSMERTQQGSTNEGAAEVFPKDTQRTPEAAVCKETAVSTSLMDPVYSPMTNVAVRTTNV